MSEILKNNIEYFMESLPELRNINKNIDEYSLSDIKALADIFAVPIDYCFKYKLKQEEENIKEFDAVLRQRRVELAMSEVPKKIKEIKEKAVNTVFAPQVRFFPTIPFVAIGKSFLFDDTVCYGLTTTGCTQADSHSSGTWDLSFLCEEITLART